MSQQLKAVLLDHGSLAADDLDMQALLNLPLEWQVHTHTSASETLDRVAGQHIVLTNKVVLDQHILQAYPNIKLIVVLATGTNNVDVKVASELGIPVCNVVDYSTESVVQHTFALILALRTRLLEYDSAIKNHRWSESPHFALLDYPISHVAGSTLGIIGMGRIGARVKSIAEAFGMRVLVSQSLTGKISEGRVPLESLLKHSDVVSLHCPLSELSQDLISYKAFETMKSTALLINTGRGGLVNESALIDALKTANIAGAATDVLTTEPPPKDHILLNEQRSNLIVTPHIAWASQESRQALVDQVVQVIRAYLSAENSGALMNRVYDD